MMELVSMELKRQGTYICRTLSYKGCEFHTVKDAITAEQVILYDEACKLWQDLYRDLDQGILDGTLIFPVKKGKKTHAQIQAAAATKKKKSNRVVVDSDDESFDDLDLDYINGNDPLNRGRGSEDDSSSDTDSDDEDDDENCEDFKPLRLPAPNAYRVVWTYFWGAHQVSIVIVYLLSAYEIR